MVENIPFINAQQVRALVSARQAREFIEGALRVFDPATDPQRSQVPAGQGHFLLMPSCLGDYAGAKIVGVARDNAKRGLATIQGVYCLFDAATLTPQLLIDGAVLTEIRTPATSAVAIDHLAAPDARHAIIVGAGPQALGHARALAEVRDLERIQFTSRTASSADDAAALLQAEGLPASAGEVDFAAADVIVCATSASEPVVPAEQVRPGTCVVAVGSHEPDRRELPAALLRGSVVVVEDRATAVREAGDVVMAIAEGAVTEAELHPMAELVAGRVQRDPERVNVFKGTGMSWQDLAVAAGIAQLYRQ